MFFNLMYKGNEGYEIIDAKYIKDYQSMKKFIAIIVAAIFVLIGIACMKNFGNGFFSFLMLAGVVVAVAWNVETNEG